MSPEDVERYLASEPFLTDAELEEQAGPEQERVPQSHADDCASWILGETECNCAKPF